MKKFIYTLLIGIGWLAMAGIANAEIYKVIDANGHITYTNVPTKGAEKLDIDPPPAPAGDRPARSTRTPTPASFPRVDSATQSQRDDTRKKILQEELKAEQDALAEAKKAYAEGEANPETFVAANGKRFRNMAKFNEKMQKLQANVDLHEKNIELLQKELSALH